MIIERKSIPGVDRWYHDKSEIQAAILYKKEQNTSRTSGRKAVILCLFFVERIQMTPELS